MFGRSDSAIWVLGLVLGMRGSMAGYLNVNMSPATQCGQSIVKWSGDDGPYHLLLTPTAHVQHGYNVWLPSIPADTTSYNLTIRQPQGLQFVLTMWGASGISYAGTTDVLTVGPPDIPSSNSTNSSSCFLTDDQILGLYSFSFNISDTSNDLPPQCTNLTMSWPTSLESNITGTITKRDESDLKGADGALDAGLPTEIMFDERDSSSSDHHGNTTYPPSMFGVIPLGNSFSIPITYNAASKYAKYLPNSSRSDNPTTWTSQGTTRLNWTISLAKGTRFILVAGIGSDQQWASGGSSALLTVGQGTTDCVGNTGGGNGVPSVTASSQPTGTGGSANTPHGSSSTPIVRTILACVLSVLGTLLIVGLFVFCYRARKRKRQAAKEGLTYPSGSLRKLTRGGATPYENNDGLDDLAVHTQLDLIASRDRVAPIDTNTTRVDSPVAISPVGPNPFVNTPPRRPLGNDTYSSGYSAQISPIDRPFRNEYDRQSSMDPLLPSNTTSSMSSPIGTYNAGGNGAGTVSTHRPLTLHDRGMALPYEGEMDDLGEDSSDLKRETLAYLGDRPSSPSPAQAPPIGPSGVTPQRRNRPTRRRRGDEQELEYVVHRDAGRIRGDQQPSHTARVELPPRYEELNWDGDGDGDRDGQGGVQGGSGIGEEQNAAPAQPPRIQGQEMERPEEGGNAKPRL